MGNAAQGEPRKHVVFETPFKVKTAFEQWKTPENYRGFPGGIDLPKKTTVWLVQNMKKTYGSVVSRSWGYEDSPDAEVLTPGFNTGKENGAVGVGRHGNFLQWGFSAPPSKMTDAGKKFFLNCVCYIHKFDGKAPLIRKESSNRINPIRLALLLRKIEDKSFGRSAFTAEQLKEYRQNPVPLARHYRDNYELIYYDKTYRVDEELKSLGIESNREISTLERLISLLKDAKKAKTARILLKRYTKESFKTPDEWQAWYQQNHDRIYFTDVGGYKFRVVPEGYLE